MALDGEDAPMAGVQEMAVECVVMDRSGRAKRRLVMPLAALLAPVRGGASGAAAPRDAS